MTAPKTVPSVSEMFDVFQMKLNSKKNQVLKRQCFGLVPDTYILNKIQPSPVPQHRLERCHGYFGIQRASLCWQTLAHQLFFLFF